MGGSCRSESELEIEREKNKEDMQEIRTMIVSMCNKHNDQLADRDREIVKLRDALEGMEIRATKAERQVVRLHSAVKERDTYRLMMAFAVISCVAICASNTLYCDDTEFVTLGGLVVGPKPFGTRGL